MRVENIHWNDEKDKWLRENRGISFEEIAARIAAREIIDVYDHPNQERYPGQQLFVVQIGDYVYLIPFVEQEDQLFLKTIIPSRKAKRKYLKRG